MIVGIPIVLLVVLTSVKRLFNRFSVEDLGVDLHTTGFTFIVATTGIDHPFQIVNQFLSPWKGPVLLVFAICIALTVGLYGKAQESLRSRNACFVLGLFFFLFGLGWALEYVGLSLLNYVFSAPLLYSAPTLFVVVLLVFFVVGMILYAVIGPKKEIKE